MDQTAKALFRRIFGKYKHFLLILLVGIGLMLLPVGGKSTQNAPAPAAQTPSVETLQAQLSQLLSQLEGAGKVQVLLTQATGEKTIYQMDTDSSADDRGETVREDTVLVSDSSRNQAGLVQRIDPPSYLGAVVLCQGAENSAVKLAITEAVANATGLGYHRITVLKMK